MRVEVRAGNADQKAIALTPGTTVEAFGVGRTASWRVSGEGVADVHAYLYFDGTSLFVASVQPANPAWVDGKPVGTEWLQLRDGCEIVLGSVRLWFGSGRSSFQQPEHTNTDLALEPIEDDDLASLEEAEPEPQVAPAATRNPQPTPVKKLRIRSSARMQATGDDEEATRFSPLDVTKPSESEQGPAIAQPMTGPLPAAGVPAPGVRAGFVPPGVGKPAFGTPASSPAVPPIAGPVAGPAIMPAASPMVPPLDVPAPPTHLNPPPGVQPAINGAANMFGMSAPSPVTSTSKVAASRSPALDKALSAWRSASMPQKAILALMPFAFVAVWVSFGEDAEPVPASKPAASASAAPRASASAPVDSNEKATAPTEATAAASATGTPTVQAPPADAPKQDKKRPERNKDKVTLQRQAADAVAAGRYADALAMYEQLAKEYPDVAAYAVAQRILRARLGGE